jgi:hypothetical protein
VWPTEVRTAGSNSEIPVGPAGIPSWKLQAAWAGVARAPSRTNRARPPCPHHSDMIIQAATFTYPGPHARDPMSIEKMTAAVRSSLAGGTPA